MHNYNLIAQTYLSAKANKKSDFGKIRPTNSANLDNTKENTNKNMLLNGGKGRQIILISNQ